VSNPLRQTLIDETAAAWAARRLGGAASDEAGFARWLAEDLAHEEAYAPRSAGCGGRAIALSKAPCSRRHWASSAP
jgi:ferric-dicitrate binding protein FerR (iron transport regulator)